MGVTIVVSMVTLIFAIFGKDASICGSLMGFTGIYSSIFSWFVWIVFLAAIILSIVWLLQQIFFIKKGY